MSKIILGDCLEVMQGMDDESVDCVITSPPYWGLRDYDTEGQLGLETDFNEYIDKLCAIFDEVKRILKLTGSCWVNIGDSYNANYRGGDFGSASAKQRSNKGTVKFMKRTGFSDKCLVQIPSRFAIAMTYRGWILRNEIIWHKPNAMPASIKDRFTVDYEKVFFFTKSKKYYFEQQLEPLAMSTAVDRRTLSGNFTEKRPGRGFTGLASRGGGMLRPNQNGRNKRSVWSISTKPLKDSHFATFPKALVEPMVKAGCPEGGIVLDPFFGAGTTGVVAKKLNRAYIGIEINPDYIKIAEQRLRQGVLL